MTESNEVILWALGGGFAGLIAFILWMGSTNEKPFDEIKHILEKMDDKITDIDRRLCRLEGAFASKDCCMIKDSRHIEKPE